MNNIDSTTGLPQLPEGWFYRIKKWTISYDLHVAVRQRLWFGISRQLGYSLADANQASIFRAADRALEKANSRVLHRGKEFVGDYPPKKLGGAA